MEKLVKFVSDYLTLSFLTIGGGIVFWLYKPAEQVSIVYMVAACLVLGLLVIMLIQHILIGVINSNKQGIKLPKLLTITSEKFIFEPSALFSTQSAVAIYSLGDVEVFIGVGYVETVISTSSNLQVIPINLDSYLNYDKDKFIRERSSIVLKPTIPIDYIQNINDNTILDGESDD